MIKIIGPKLIIIMLLLVSFNSALFGSWFFYTTPMKEQAKLNLIGINAEIAKLRSSIINIKDEIKYYEEKQEEFKSLVSTGYMEELDRFAIAENLENFRKKSHIQTLSYDISNSLEIENKTAEKAKHSLLQKRITLEGITSFFDTDIYRFVQLLNTKFPGHTRIVSVEIERPKPNEFETILEKISTGKSIPLLNAKVTLDWYALVKQPETEKLPTTPR